MFNRAFTTISVSKYISRLAGKNKIKLLRKVLPKAFKQVFIRLTILFLCGFLYVCIVYYSNDLIVTASINELWLDVVSSLYVITMNNLGITVLLDIVNITLTISTFCTDRTLIYCFLRTLYGMTFNRYAPKIFKRCNKKGVPIYSVGKSLCWTFRSLLQLNSNSVVALNWLINIVTSSLLISFVYLRLI